MGLIITDTRGGSHPCPDTAGLGQLLPERRWAAVTVPSSLDMSLLSVLGRDSLQRSGGAGAGEDVRIFSSLRALSTQNFQDYRGRKSGDRAPGRGPGPVGVGRVMPQERAAPRRHF